MMHLPTLCVTWTSSEARLENLQQTNNKEIIFDQTAGRDERQVRPIRGGNNDSVTNDVQVILVKCLVDFKL